MSVDLSARGTRAKQRNPNADDRVRAIEHARMVIRFTDFYGVGDDDYHLRKQGVDFVNLARQFLRAIGLSES